MADPGTNQEPSESERESERESEWELERSDLVATLAHELRSPLTGMKGFVQAVLNRWDKLSDEQKKFMLSTALVDADRLSRLITEMLDVARLDTGRLQLHRRAVDPAPIVARAVEGQRLTGERSIDFEPGEGLGSIHADPDKFAQVVVNLLDNAVRHGAGVISVSLSLEEPEEGPLADPESARLLLSVCDEGDGIPDALRERVFTKYWKGGSSAGSGLGLYIVGGLVEAHGGAVEIHDRQQGGACLEVRWPLWHD